ncbi:hypothetical protein MKW92_046442 [Papaver armeniacum]|nr:hypothetical protein MKW92_046442 [Papaver armeniacum]
MGSSKYDREVEDEVRVSKVRDRSSRDDEDDRKRRSHRKHDSSDGEEGQIRVSKVRDDDDDRRRKSHRKHDSSGDEEGEVRVLRDDKKRTSRDDDDDDRRRKSHRKHDSSSNDEEGRVSKVRDDDRDRRRSHRKHGSDDDEDRHRKSSRRRDKDEDDEDRSSRRRRDRDRDEDRSSRRRDRDRGGRGGADNDVGEDVKKSEEEASEARKIVDYADLGKVGKSGGIYVPPFRLKRMMRGMEDKSSPEYQRLTWDALRKSINGLVNKVNARNIKNIIPELFAENLIRGRGLFCRSCMKSQMASPGFTDVFAALSAVVNTKFPEVGELLLKRIVLQLKRAYKRNDKPQLLAATKFIAHLVNQQVAHEIIALELLTVLLENPTDDSVEVAVGFVTECGSLLQDLTPKGLHGIFERFRGILHEGEIDKRVQFLIEGLFAIRKAKFLGHPAVRPELDLVEQEDQLTHELSLEDTMDPETSLDIFKVDLNFLENEKKYEDLKRNILGDDQSSEEEGSDAPSDGEDDDDSDEEDEDEEQMKIQDETETNLVNLRRTIYLTIMSSVDFEEAGHKLLKIKLEPGQEMELCIMLLECCSQERTYLRYYGLLGQRFCMINRIHQENFEKCFVQQYSMIHRLETNKLRNVAKFFAHLLGTDALPWHVLAYIRLTEEDTTSSSRIFIKILFQELSEHLGIRLLNERLTDPAMQDSFESIFPRDNPKNTRFSINFFTSIGLGGITENLREYLKNMPRLIMQQQKEVSESEGESGSSSSSGGDSSSSESESESSSSESEREKRKRRHSEILLKYAVGNEERFCSAPPSEVEDSSSKSQYWKVTNPTLSPIHLQDLPGFTRSVYKRDHALITPESHVFSPLPEWKNTLGAYLVTPAMGAHFVMYLAKMEVGSMSALPPIDVERFVFVVEGIVTLTNVSRSTHKLLVDSYAYLPANLEHSVTCDAPATLVVFERRLSTFLKLVYCFELNLLHGCKLPNKTILSFCKIFSFSYRYASLPNHIPEQIVGSTDKQPLLDTPGEVFELRKLLPMSAAYDFNVHIMDFQPGEFLNVKEVHYNQHGLLLLEGQGIYRLGDNWYPVQSGDAIWMAPFVPQWYAALGKTRSRYLLYKDVNRNPL